MNNPTASLLAACAVVLAACVATPQPSQDAPDRQQALLQRLGGPDPVPLLAEGRMIWGDVEWATFVSSFPPDAVSVTRDAEAAVTTLGMAGGRAWGLDELTGQMRDLPAEFSYVLRQQELFRLVDRLATWHFERVGEPARVDGEACRQLHYTDDFAHAVTLCVSDETGLPVIISIETPDLHGGGTLHAYPRAWEALQGRTYLTGYDIIHGQREYNQTWRSIVVADPNLRQPVYPGEATAD